MQKQFVVGLIAAVIALGLPLLGATGGQTAEPVDVKKLQTLLPAVSGWTRGQPGGSRQDLPFPISEAAARYVNGKLQVTLDIMDPVANQLFLGPLSAALAAGGLADTTGDVKPTVVTIAGLRALEKWDPVARRGSDGLIVGKRFIVEAKGSNLDSVDILHGFIEKMDVARLASMK